MAAWVKTLYFHSVFCLLFWNKSSSRKTEATDSRLDELILHVEHAFKEGSNEEFKPRGTVSVRSLKNPTGVFIQHEPLARDDIYHLKELAKKDGFYRVRVPTKFGFQTSGDVPYVSTFVKACALYESKLTENITISVDSTGHVYGIGISVPVGECEGKAFEPDVGSTMAYFNTTVTVLPQVAGPLPDTLTYIQKLEKERAEQAGGKKQDNRSFLAKYWMYIVPVVIFMMLSSQQPEPGQGGEGGGS